MKIYRNSIIIISIISIVEFICSFTLKFYFSGNAVEFWYDISIGIFSGAILTLITCIIGYRVERKNVLEGFWLCTHKILKQINEYEASMSIEQKIDFFINFYDTDRIEWHTYFGEISFLFDFGKRNYKYICDSIYEPINKLGDMITLRYWKFRWHKDGSGRNEKVMEYYIDEIEPLIIETKDYKIPTEIDDNGKIISETLGSSKCNKLFRDITNELSGRYYEIIYGKHR